MDRVTLKSVIITKNEARNIAACVESLAWSDEVVVVDDHSTDGTAALARETGARVIPHRFENFAQQRNAALNLVEADWIFFVDADERATPALGEEIRRVVMTRPEVGWWVPRHNYIFGHRMRGAGWWPDHQLRVLRPDKARYDPQRPVHEVVVLSGGEAGYLTSPLIHYNYETLAQFTAKQRRYLAYDVGILLERLQEEGARPKVYTPYREAWRHFWWRFAKLAGWRDGAYGLLLSALMAYYEMQKYRRVRQALRSDAAHGRPTP
jgi:hypothetical protein